MDTKELANLNIRLVNSAEIYPKNHLAGEKGIALLVAQNAVCRVVIALQGAHVISFAPTEKDDFLWLSPRSFLKQNTPIRGGIPLCLPWFGAQEGSALMHGFARIKEWVLASAKIAPCGGFLLSFSLKSDETIDHAFPHPFVFTLEILASTHLKMRLKVENKGNNPAQLAAAFHTYFAIPELKNVSITGLEGKTYLDKTAEMARKIEAGTVKINGWTDRVYLDVNERQTLDLSARKLHIDSPAKCAIVWNPCEKAENMADVGKGNHAGFVCVERGDVADYAVSLAPQETYETWMDIRLG